MRSAAPHSEIDLFGDETLIDPYPSYGTLRDMGPVVYLERHSVSAVTRYAELRTTLQDWKTFCSGEGIALNDAKNRQMRGSVLASDPPAHKRLRGVLAPQLAPRALRAVTEDIERQADELVGTLVRRGDFDAVNDLARPFALSVVVGLIGLPDGFTDKILPWADATFNTLGPPNWRTDAAGPLSAEMYHWLAGLHADDLAPGSMGRAVFDAGERGDINLAACPKLLGPYVVAGMDTTINAVGNAVQLLAEHPEQWDMLRADPSLGPAALNEVLRYDSPIQAFSRVTQREVRMGDAVIEEGERVVLLYGAGNRDERHYQDPDRFDIRRNPVDHLSFGFGVHACPGQHLGRIEALALLEALLRHASGIEIGTPVRRLNNVVRGLDALPVQATPATGPHAGEF